MTRILSLLFALTSLLLLVPLASAAPASQSQKQEPSTTLEQNEVVISTNPIDHFKTEIPNWGTPIWKLLGDDHALRNFLIGSAILIPAGIFFAIWLPRVLTRKIKHKAHPDLVHFAARTLRVLLWSLLCIGELLIIGYELHWILTQKLAHAVIVLFIGLPLTLTLPKLVSRISGEHLHESVRKLLVSSLRTILWILFFIVLIATYGVNVSILLATYPILRAALTLILGLLLARLIPLIISRFMRDRITPQANMLLARILWTSAVIIVSLWALSIIGYDLTPFLATAGVAGLAIGFAAQTTLSNVISGIFLVNERPYNLQDLIEVNGIRGFVEEIGLLSIFLRTIDNRLVRIPNEMILKGSMINITRYPIRRCDITVGVAYGEDINTVMDILKEAISKNPLSLDDPEPLILFEGFGDSSLNFRVGPWCRTQDYGTVQTQISRDIKEAFDLHGIEIPFPHRTLEVGQNSGPIKIEIQPPATPASVNPAQTPDSPQSL